jgi:hypothetical protein
MTEPEYLTFIETSSTGSNSGTLAQQITIVSLQIQRPDWILQFHSLITLGVEVVLPKSPGPIQVGLITFVALLAGLLDSAVLAKLAVASSRGSVRVLTSGFIGGTGQDSANDVCADAAGDAYVCGTLATANDQTDAFVAKVSGSSGELIYLLAIGGDGADAALGVTVDPLGRAWVVGDTTSTEATFPVEGGPGLNYNGATDGWIACIEQDGSSLLTSGYIGGAGLDVCTDVSWQPGVGPVVVGRTNSAGTSFPVTNALDPSANGELDGFVCAIAQNGSSIRWCTFLGGGNDDLLYGVACDAGGNVFVAGDTLSDQATIPAVSGPSTIHSGRSDVLVAKLSPDGNELLFSGFIGGSGFDYGRGVDVTLEGDCVLSGYTSSNERSFPVRRGPQKRHFRGRADAWVAHIQGDDASIDYCGYIAGKNVDESSAVAAASDGSVWVVGATRSRRRVRCSP